MNDHDPLAGARLRLAAIKASGRKVERLDPVERAKRNPGSKRDAIDAMCWQCCGCGVDGDKETRDRILECSVTVCALHPHRPYQPTEPEAA